MEDNSSEVEQLVAQSKKLRDVCKKRNYLEKLLSELTVCKNVAALSTGLKIFSTKVLNVACQVVPSSNLPLQLANQTLIITVQNVSDNFVFNSEHWQFCVGVDSTQSTWNLDTSLKPGQIDKFCFPLKTSTFNLPQHKISVALKFTIQFESKTYTRHFPVQESIVDALYFLDPGRSLGESCTVNFAGVRSFVDRLSDNEPDISFDTIKRFIVHLDASLKARFVKEILLRDCVHRGFSESLTELVTTSEISVYYNNLEKVLSVKLKLSSFESECNPESVDVDGLMKFYLELREVTPVII